MNEMYDDTPSESPSLLSKLAKNRSPTWLALLLLILLALTFVWKQLAVGAAENRLEEERQTLTQQFEADKAAVLSQARQALAQNSEQAHRLLGQSLSWAVRGELIRNNLDQIDQYFQELVKTERIRLIVLVGGDGNILLSTDKKLQGSALAEVLPGNLLDATQVAIQPAPEANEKFLVIPVMGLNTRLGTAILRYAPEAGL